VDDQSQNFYAFIDFVIHACLIGLSVLLADWLIFGSREGGKDGDKRE